MAAPELFLMSNSPIEATDVKGGVVDFKVRRPAAHSP